MANSISHAALPFPIKGCRYTIGVPFLDADGDPTDPTTPDTERSIDGAAFADCTEEETTVSTGFGYITLTGDEMAGSLIMVNFKSASGPKYTPVIIYPRVLPVLSSGTAQAGAAGSITLAAGGPAYDLAGCIVRTTGGTGGGGGSGSQGNQARVITAYNPSTKVATVVPNWETTPDNTTTYEVLLSDLGANAPVSNITSMASDVITAAAMAADASTEIFTKIFQTALTQSYAAAGAAPTLEQFLFMIWSALAEFGVLGTTITCKKLDGSTTSMTFTLDDASNPSSRTRST